MFPQAMPATVVDYSPLDNKSQTLLDQANSYLFKAASILDVTLQNFRRTPGGQPPHQGGNHKYGTKATNCKTGAANIEVSEPPSVDQIGRERTCGEMDYNPESPYLPSENQTFYQKNK